MLLMFTRMSQRWNDLVHIELNCGVAALSTTTTTTTTTTVCWRRYLLFCCPFCWRPRPASVSRLRMNRDLFERECFGEMCLWTVWHEENTDSTWPDHKLWLYRLHRGTYKSMKPSLYRQVRTRFHQFSICSLQNLSLLSSPLSSTCLLVSVLSILSSPPPFNLLAFIPPSALHLSSSPISPPLSLSLLFSPALTLHTCTLHCVQ